MAFDSGPPSSFAKKFMASSGLKGVTFTGRELGAGSDATVEEVDYKGTLLAAKKLHQDLLDDETPGGRDRLVGNLEDEIAAWCSLRHPHIVLLIGLHYERGSRIPILILEKMQSSLRRYIEKHKKEEVPLPDKVFILHQVSQALVYLHARDLPLVHHDLSPNNILLNQDTLLTKITDIGMSRAVAGTHRSTPGKTQEAGTLAFMPPEVLRTVAIGGPPNYSVELDIFSFGNVILFILSHLWPHPSPSSTPSHEGGKHIVLETEFQRREQYTRNLTEEEDPLLLIAQLCLQDQPGLRPTSLTLVEHLKQIEEAHPRPDYSRESRNTITASADSEFPEQPKKHSQSSSKKEIAQLKWNNNRQQMQLGSEQMSSLLQERDDQIQQMQKLIKKRDDELQRMQDLEKSWLHLNQDKDHELQRMQERISTLLQENERLQQERVSDVPQRQVYSVQSTACFY